MTRDFINLAKPGIIFGNVVSVLGGFFLAAQGSVDVQLLLATLLGTSLVVASGCVINNIIDRDIDRYMERTCGRALVTQAVSVRAAWVYAALLAIGGFGLLHLQTNALAVLLAALGLAVYAGLYSLYLKRHSVHQTLIGSISGACPPVIGYCAVSQQFDLGALILFVTFCLWQMPHSFGIAVYRLGDYRSAGIPILPVKSGIRATKVQSLIYTLLFMVSGSLLYVAGYTDRIYLLVFLLTSAYWVHIALAGFSAEDDRAWARHFYLFSILAITIFSISISVNYLPRP